MHHAITNGLLRQGWALPAEAPRSLQVHMGMEEKGWDHHFMGSTKQYVGKESWDPQGREGGDQYRAWNDYNEGGAAQYTDMRSTWGDMEGSYDEDHYPYAWRDAVDDIVHEKDFQDVHDKNNHVPWYPSFYGNVYNRTEHYLEPSLFRSSEWDDEKGLCIQIIEDDVNIMCRHGGNSSHDMNRDNEDIHDFHSLQGSNSIESTSPAQNPWPFYNNLYNSTQF